MANYPIIMSSKSNFSFSVKIPSMVVRAHVFISGDVQGVFFRRTAKLEAEKLSLIGWVRNRPDGEVELVAQGPKDKVNQFIKWCRRGPPFAKVENVEVEWKRNLEDFEEFEIV